MHAATTPQDGWWPALIRAGGTRELGRALSGPMAAGLEWMLQVHLWLAHLIPGIAWPQRLWWAALVLTALAVAVLATSFRRLQLPPVAAGLLALVAALAPVLWSQSVTPLGPAPLLLVAAVLLRVMVAGQHGRASTGISLGLAVVGVTIWWWADHDTTAVRGMVAELGGPGAVLVAAALSPRLISSVPGRVARPLTVDQATGSAFAARHDVSIVALLGLGVALWAGVSPLGAVAQVAAAAPFAWALVALGIIQLLGWRGRGLTRATGAWLVLGLAAWAGLHAAARPWHERADMATVTASWATAVADAVSPATPLLRDRTPAGALVGAHLRARGRLADRIALASLDHADGPGAHPLLLPGAVPAAQWMGLVTMPAPAAIASLTAIVGGLPDGMLVVAAVSASAAATMAPADWLALAGIGSRLGSAGFPRARVLAGVSGMRSAGMEAAEAGHVTRSLLPGDLVGQSPLPSPVDLRLDASASEAAIYERDRPRAASSGIVMVVYRPDGQLLAVWSGADAGRLSPAMPGTAGPLLQAIRSVLPCLDVAPGDERDIAGLATDGAVGVQMPAAATYTVAARWPDGHPTPPFATVDHQHHEPARHDAGTMDGGPITTAITGEPFGLDVRGRPEALLWRADVEARLCAAGPLQRVTRPEANLDVRVHPRDALAFGGGWHDMEPMGGGLFFRWMSGPRATLLFVLEKSEPLVITLDAQSVGAAGPHDRLGVTVNGTSLNAQGLFTGRGIYEVEVPANLVRVGLNELTLKTTLVLRPSDVQAGGDGRALGLALYGWRIGTPDSAPTPAEVAPG